MPFIVIAAAAVTFPTLFFVTAPYGRHFRAGWGPSLPARFAWLLMESPAALLFLWAWLQNPARDGLLGALWLTHYGYRAFVFPWRASGQKPWLTVAIALAFNTVNALGNGAATCAQPVSARYLLGVALFVTGFAINLHSDAVLRRLRPHGYAVPQAGLHRWVAAPNYLGEIIEWSGFALAAWHLPGLAFALFTFANLAPRARSHLKWYREKFGADYPASRRALIPFVY